MVYGAAPHEMASPLLADESAPLVDREERKRSTWSRAVRYGGAMAVGALLVGAGVVTTSPSHPVSVTVRGGLASLGASNAAKHGSVGPLKYGGKHANKVAHAGKSHRHAAPSPVPHAERVAASSVYHRLGEGEDDQDVGGDDITDDPLAQLDDLNKQVERLVEDNKALTEDNMALEKQVQDLEQSIVDTREEFLKVGHGGRNKHLAGSHENEIIADLENQLKDKHYELEKTRQQKYKLYVKNADNLDKLAKLDKDLATCAQDKAELAIRAEEVSELEECKASLDALSIKMTDAQDDLETCKVDLAAARGDDHDDNARIAALEDKLSHCKSEKGDLADELVGIKVELKNSKADKLKTDALVEELNAKAAASDALADRLRGEVDVLVEDVKACELDGRSFNFFCAGEGETCECPDGDVVFGPRYHASDDSWENTFADVVALQRFTVTPGTSDFSCDIDHTGKDVAPGAGKACFCVPKGIVATPVVDAKGEPTPVDMPAIEPKEEDHSLFDNSTLNSAPAMVACDSEKSCQAAAEAAGLQIGGGGYDFAGTGWKSKGCYTYNSGKYEGMAFFGSDGDAVAMSEPLDEPKVRIMCPAPPRADDITAPAPVPVGEECTGRTVTVKRMDPNGLDGHGWGMRLEFMCGDSKVHIGNSRGSQTQSTVVNTEMLPDDCPARIDKSNWLGGYGYGDFFDVTVGECPPPSPPPVQVCKRTITATRGDRPHGWGMPLEFECSGKVVHIGSSHGRSKSTTTTFKLDVDDCPSRVDKSNWRGGHTYGDWFSVDVGPCVGAALGDAVEYDHEDKPKLGSKPKLSKKTEASANTWKLW